MGAIAEHSNEIQYDKERVRIIQNFLKVHLLFKKIATIVLIIGCLYLNANALQILMNIKFSDDIYSCCLDFDFGMSETQAINQYFEEHDVKKDTPIFSYISVTATLENLGYHKLYVDCRPEMFNYENSGVMEGESILEEYVRLYYGEYEKLKPYTSEEIKIILESYGFEYLILESDCYLREYLDESPDYKLQ